MPHRKPTDMQKMPPEQQQAVAQRFAIRKDVRAANEALFEFVMQWITGMTLTREAFFRLFNAAGHRGEYHLNPSTDTKRRLIEMRKSLAELRQRVKDTPLDFMGVIELGYALQRIHLMLEALAKQPRGTIDDAIELYEAVGEAIRAKVYFETGHWPEEFELPIDSGRITGEENPGLFRVQSYQPLLLDEFEGE